MLTTNNAHWIKPAMKVIREYAPETFNAMINYDWPVTVVTDFADMLPISHHVGFSFAALLADEIDGSLGVTVACTTDEPDSSYDGPPVLYHTTWLNRRELESNAHRLNVPVAKMAANVLVHEWAHIQGCGERDAYKAGTRFAVAMGEPAIAEYSEKVSRKVNATLTA